MMMPLYGTALASVSRWMVVLKAFSLDCMQCEAPVWRHWLWHSTSGMGDIHPGRQSCNCSPPVLYPSLTGSCLSSVESPSFSFHTVFPIFFLQDLNPLSDHPISLLGQGSYSFSWLIWWATLSIKLQYGQKYALEILGLLFQNWGLTDFSKFLQARGKISIVLNNKVVNSLKVMKSPCLELFTETKEKSFTVLK